VSTFKDEFEHNFALDGEAEPVKRPHTLVLSANDAASLKGNIEKLCRHLANPRVAASLEDLAFTLSERRTRHWHRAFVTTQTTELGEGDFAVGKNSGQPLRAAFVFTGQGAQWPQMGRDLVQHFPQTRGILEELDRVLQAQPHPPAWSLVAELTELRSPEHLRQPEFAQPLATAMQLCLFAVLESWGVRPSSVVGHSSGEIAAAYAAGRLDRAGAIKAAFYRGRAAVNARHIAEVDVGMLAVGLGPDAVTPFLQKHEGNAWVACHNSPGSVTVSGRKSTLGALEADIKAEGHFARLLQVDLAYHSELMRDIGEEYERLLEADVAFKPQHAGAEGVTMFSSVTGAALDARVGSAYWKKNMVSPVRFSDALTELVAKDTPNFIVEIGPSGALAGPVSQVLKALPGADVPYCAAWSRGAKASKSLFDVAGKLFMSGAPIDFSLVNNYGTQDDTPRTIIDLPNYAWNHSIKYWHENAASRDWRHKQFITHDLLGAKIPGTSWESPTWRKHLQLADVPWLRDHKMGPDVLVPGAGLACLALEAMFQKYVALNPGLGIASANELAYRFRNTRFERAVVVEEGRPTTILLSLTPVPGSKDWHEWRVRTVAGDATHRHCGGLIRVQEPLGDEEALAGDALAPLRYPQSAAPWYKAQREVGMGFGPAFQKIKAIESVSGSRKCRALVSLEPPASKWDPQSYYPLHPAVLDCCLQTATPANAAGERSLIRDTMIPALVDDMVVNKMPKNIPEGLGVAESIYTGRGRPDVARSWIANISIHDPKTGLLIMRVKGLNYIRLDVDEQPDPHVFHKTKWMPDVSLLTPQLRELSLGGDGTRANIVVDLFAYKTPGLNVLEINLDESDTSSFWFNTGDQAVRAAYSSYTFGTPGAKALVSVPEATADRGRTDCVLLKLAHKSLGLTDEKKLYDLIILKAPNNAVNLVKEVLEKTKCLLTPCGNTIIIRSEVLNQDTNEYEGSEDSNSLGSAKTISHDSNGSHTTTNTSLSSSTNFGFSLSKLVQKSSAPGQAEEQTGSVMEIDDGTSYLYTLHQPASKTSRRLIIGHFDTKASATDSSMSSLLVKSGWSVSEAQILDLANNPPNPETIILVPGELQKPILHTISAAHWTALQALTASRPQRLLWLTHAAHGDSGITNPAGALAAGLFRVVRRENPSATLVTLDAHSDASSTEVATAVARVLDAMDASTAESEYAERGGVVHIPRLRAAEEVNALRAAERRGLEPVVRGLHAAEAQVRIQAEKVGTLQSLVWCETAVGEVEVEEGMVEIEVMAVGVNFKVSGRVTTSRREKGRKASTDDEN
jgi:acyl transferase domain-containing protein